MAQTPQRMLTAARVGQVVRYLLYALYISAIINYNTHLLTPVFQTDTLSMEACSHALRISMLTTI